MAEAKLLQHQVWMLEVSGSRRNGESDVSSPSPSPTYIRLIQRQEAQVSVLEVEGKNRIFVNLFSEQGNARGFRKEPCGACVSCREPCVWEDGKASCDTCRRWKVACDLSGQKPHRSKAKQKGGSIIDSDEDAQGEPE